MAVADKQTILIVDDTPLNVDLLSDVFKAEYRTKVATNGEKALRLAQSDPAPDLVLLDVMMPRMSGYEVCERLKAASATRDIPVIFVSAMGEVEDETKGLEVGGVDYITKPISPPIVLARVRTHLALYQQKRALSKLVGQLEAQAAQLADLTRTLAMQAAQLAELNESLETRVTNGVAELERLSRFKRFFSPAVAELILGGSAEDPLKSHRRDIVVVFLDLRGFTSFTESADPEEVMGALAEYHEAMGRLIVAHNGTLERFTGDGMMIFFNDPVPIENPAAEAVRMALAMQQAFMRLGAGWRARGYDLTLGIGIARGYATIGAIGFEGRRDYGAIGNVTNLAARLCGEAKGGQVLVTDRVHGSVAELVNAEPAGELALRGLRKPVAAFDVLGMRDELDWA